MSSGRGGWAPLACWCLAPARHPEGQHISQAGACQVHIDEHHRVFMSLRQAPRGQGRQRGLAHAAFEGVERADFEVHRLHLNGGSHGCWR